MNGRLIAIGDIHGCHAEFAEMLQRLEPAPADRFVLLGDLINRGPDSTKVIDLARSLKAVALLGNHELRLLECWRGQDRSVLKEKDEETFSRMRPDDWTYLEGMALTHEAPEYNTVFVHGGFVPGQPWRTQPAAVVTNVQVIDGDGNPRRRSECPDRPAWADLWTGPPFVVYGHTPRPEIYRLKWSVDIDTGCVMGGHLTAYILPDNRFVQVKAQKNYFAE